MNAQMVLTGSFLNVGCLIMLTLVVYLFLVFSRIFVSNKRLFCSTPRRRFLMNSCNRVLVGLFRCSGFVPGGLCLRIFYFGESLNLIFLEAFSIISPATSPYWFLLIYSWYRCLAMHFSENTFENLSRDIPEHWSKFYWTLAC